MTLRRFALLFIVCCSGAARARAVEPTPVEALSAATPGGKPLAVEKSRKTLADKGGYS